MIRPFRPLLLRMLWSGVRRRYLLERPTVVAITGSVGKTSAKEAVATVLAATGRPVVKTFGNLNTATGVALSLLGFATYPRGAWQWLRVGWRSLVPPAVIASRPYYVLEFGTDKPGDIPFLAVRLPIDVAVLTRIVPAHAEFFPAFEDYVREKLSLVEALKPGGYAVLNADDENQRGIAAPACWYGLKERVQGKEMVLGHHVGHAAQGLSFTASFATARRMDTIGGKQPGSVRIQTNVIGQHQAYPLLAAAAVGFREGLPPEKIGAALSGIPAQPGRGGIIEGRKGISIIDDTYNASPEAVKAGLDMLRGYAGSRRVVAVLGRMNELGPDAPRFHEEVAKYAAGKADFLVFVGEYASRQAKAAVKAGQATVQCIAFATTEGLIDKLDQVVNRGDVVYVKGSQNGVRLERAVKALMLHPEDAPRLLVRQNSHWKP